MNYEHTQVGRLIIIVLIAVALLFGFILVEEGLEPVALVLMIIVFIATASFASLTVTIDGSNLRIKFGYGIFRKKFRLTSIVSAKIVKNHWYHGWGIRVWVWPYMWIYNVSGFDAVEIRMKNGKIYRIGTDEPKRLENAIT